MDKLLTRLNERRRGWRVILLGLALMAVVGPWAFDTIIVPEEYECDIRLEGDRCGVPVSGLYMLWATTVEFGRRVGGIFSGDVTLGQFGQGLLLFAAALLLLSPILITLLMLWRGETSTRRRLLLAGWGAAAALALLVLFSGKAWGHLWGAWLYILLALCALALEMLTLRQSAPAAPGKA